MNTPPRTTRDPDAKLRHIEAVPSRALQLARQAFDRADYKTANLLIDVETTSSLSERAAFELLRARVGRFADDEVAWYEGAAFAARNSASERDRLTARALLAGGAKKRGLVAEAATAWSALRASIEPEPSPENAEAAYLMALDFWQDRDYDAAARLARKYISSGNATPQFHALLGWIDVKLERYVKAGPHFMRALRAVDANDLRNKASIIRAIAIVASDTVDLRLGRRALREYEKFPWPESLWLIRFNVLTCLAIHQLLEGDPGKSWFTSREAVLVARHPSYAATGETAAAGASRLLGDEAALRLQLGRAWELLRAIRWGDAIAEERQALANFALEGAILMPAEARKAIIILESLRAKSAPLNALDGDRRIDAFNEWAAARVAEASGRRDVAIERYTLAHELWTQLGYLFRAALVAIDLQRITGDDAWLASLDVVYARAPKAHLR